MLGLADLTLKMDSKSKVSDDNEVYDMILHLKWATDYGDIYDELKEQSKSTCFINRVIKIIICSKYGGGGLYGDNKIRQT